MLANENYTDKIQDTDFKRLIIKRSKNSKCLKKKQRNSSDKLRIKSLRRINIRVKIQLMEVTRTVQNLRTEFNKKTGTLESTQAGMKME